MVSNPPFKPFIEKRATISDQKEESCQQILEIPQGLCQYMHPPVRKLAHAINREFLNFKN